MQLLRCLCMQANHTFKPALSGAINPAGTHFEFDIFADDDLLAYEEATVSYGDTQDNQTLMEKYGARVLLLLSPGINCINLDQVHASSVP